MSQDDITKCIKDSPPRSSKDIAKLVDEYNKSKIVETKTVIAKQITEIWKIVVIINTCATIAITMLTGFTWSTFELEDEAFITTIASLTISSFLLGTIPKLLKINE